MQREQGAENMQHSRTETPWRRTDLLAVAARVCKCNEPTRKHGGGDDVCANLGPKVWRTYAQMDEPSASERKTGKWKSGMMREREWERGPSGTWNIDGTLI